MPRETLSKRERDTMCVCVCERERERHYVRERETLCLHYVKFLQSSNDVKHIRKNKLVGNQIGPFSVLDIHVA